MVQGWLVNFQLVLFNTREHLAIFGPSEVCKQEVLPSGTSIPLLRQVQSGAANTGFIIQILATSNALKNNDVFMGV